MFDHRRRRLLWWLMSQAGGGATSMLFGPGVPVPSAFSFTRASTATDDAGGAGPLTSYPIDVIRDGLGAGVLLEGAATNLIPNPRAEGGGAQAPTGWTVGSPNAGLTVTWPGQVTLGGIVCQLLRFQGTMSSNGSLGNIQFASGLAVTAAAGAMSSVWAQVYAGSLNGISAHNLRIAAASVTTLPVTVDATFSRKSASFSFAADTTAAPQIVPTGANAAAIDVTYALGAPNLTSGTVLTSPVFPTAGSLVASTRAADSLTIIGSAFANVFGAGAPQGFIIADVLMPQLAPAAAAQTIAQVGVVGDALQRLLLIMDAGATFVWAKAIVGTTATTPSPGTVTAGTAFRVGMRWGNGLLACCKDGGPVQSVATTIPASTGMSIGSTQTVSGPLNGRIRGLWAGGTAPTDAKFQAACISGANVDAALA